MSAAEKLQSEINHYLALLSDRKKKAVLTVVKSFVEQQELDLWDELSDNVKASIMRGLKQSKQGKGTPHHLVMKKYERWLKK